MGTRTTLVALAVATGALLITAAPAGAEHPHPPFVPPAPPDPISDTGYQPAENRPPSPPLRACGTKIIVDEVNRYFAVEERVREYPDGVTRIDGRGQVILQATAADGRRARLDASGPYTVIIDEDANVVNVYGRGATVVTPFSDLERASVKAAGLPVFSQYSGQTHFRDTLDPKTGDVIASKVIERPRFVTNACHLLHR